MYSLFFQIIGVDEETDEVEISYMFKKNLKIFTCGLKK
jgi:hypothetical protein